MLSNKANKYLAFYLLFLLALIGVASVCDYSISSFIYHGKGNFISTFFEAIGKLPSFIMLYLSGMLLVFHRARTSKFKNLLWLLIAGVSILGVTALLYSEVSDAVATIPSIIIILIGFAAAFFIFRTVNFSSREDIFRFIFIVVFVCIGTMAITYILKYICARPRMSFIFNGDVPFAHWWQFGAIEVSGSLPENALTSFPSGHTACAACALLLMYIPYKKGKIYPFLIAILFTNAVAVSRLFAGAHFLSDVVFSQIITVVLLLLGYLFFYRKSAVFNLLYKLFS